MKKNCLIPTKEWTEIQVMIKALIEYKELRKSPWGKIVWQKWKEFQAKTKADRLKYKKEMVASRG